MLVRELMTTDLATLSPASSLKVALRTLAGRRVTAAPVVGADGSLVGIVSESDLVDGLLEPDPRVRLSRPVTRMPESSGVVVADVMSTPVLTVGPDDDVADALDRCARADVKSVPVVDGRGHVVGMVSRSDVVLLLSQSDAEVRAAVTDLLRDAGGRWQVEVRDGVVRLASSGTTSEDRTAAELLVSAVPGVLAVEHTEEIPS